VDLPTHQYNQRLPRVERKERVALKAHDVLPADEAVRLKARLLPDPMHDRGKLPNNGDVARLIPQRSAAETPHARRRHHSRVRAISAYAAS
jgi:hypothetical protein